MGKKRSNVEIYAAILSTAKGGAKKSHIVYKANLNFEIVRKYLDHLKSAGLIAEPAKGGSLFVTTEKGIDYLSRFEELKDYLEESDITA